MAIIIPTSLTKFQLTEAEQISGNLLNLQNLQVLQNLLAESCEEKLNLKFEPSNSTRFLQQEAELQGRIGIIKYIIQCSHDAELDVLISAQNGAEDESTS